MKVYIVWSSSGSYDDYYKKVEKIFLDQIKAEEFKNTYNQNLHNKRQLAKLCMDCDYQNIKWDRVKDIERVVKQLEENNKCGHCTLRTNQYGGYKCINEECAYSEDHEAWIEECEVEE